jgi:integrase
VGWTIDAAWRWIAQYDWYSHSCVAFLAIACFMAALPEISGWKTHETGSGVMPYRATGSNSAWVGSAPDDFHKKAGLPHVRLHDLRHSHTSLMLKQGVHPKIVSERLGHASITITLDARMMKLRLW